MSDNNIDVKEGAASSAAGSDVKNPTTVEEVVEQFAKGAGTTDVEQTGKAEADVPAEEEAAEGVGQESTKTEEAAGEPAVEEAESTEGEQTEEGHEEAIPYDRFKEVNERAKQYEPLAQAQVQLQEFCVSNQITPSEFQETMQLLALKRTNPTEAAKRFLSLAESIEVSTGSKLPSDLAQEVEEGTLSEARAKELAQLRVAKNGLEQTTQQTIQQQQQQYLQDMSATLVNWAGSKSKADPAFKPKTNDKAEDGKFEDFTARFQLRCSQKLPTNAREVLATAEAAYADVMSLAKRYGPKPVKRKVLTNSSAAKTITPPKTMDDVVEQFAASNGIR